MKNYKKLYEELRQAIDGGYALATHEDALEFIYVKRGWVGLTQGEFETLINDAGFTRSDLLMMGACIEQIVDLVKSKLKEKNT